MKRPNFSIRRTLAAASALLLAVAIFTACKKDSGGSTEMPASGLMAFNVTIDRPAVGIALSGNLVSNSPLGFTNYTGGYLSVYPGSEPVQSYDFTKDSTLATSAFTFENKKYYSVFVVGNNGNYKNVVVNDNMDSLSSSQAYVRYINAIPDSSATTVTISAGGNKVVNSAAPFTTVSNFTAVNPGDVNIAIANGNEFSTNRTITVETGKIYTVLLVGAPAATDTAKAVQIKYIQNGGV